MAKKEDYEPKIYNALSLEKAAEEKKKRGNWEGAITFLSEAASLVNNLSNATVRYLREKTNL